MALGWLWGAYRLAINTLWGGFDVALMWLWVALGSFGSLDVGCSVLDVGCSPQASRMQLPSPASLGVVWGHSGQTLDILWYHRTPSNPRFRSATLIQLAPPAALAAGSGPCSCLGGPCPPRSLATGALAGWVSHAQNHYVVCRPGDSRRWPSRAPATAPETGAVPFGCTTECFGKRPAAA